MLEIKHDEDVDSHSLDLNERPFRSRFETKEVNVLPPPQALPEGITTMKIPQVSPNKTQDFKLNTVRMINFMPQSLSTIFYI